MEYLIFFALMQNWLVTVSHISLNQCYLIRPIQSIQKMLTNVIVNVLFSGYIKFYYALYTYANFEFKVLTYLLTLILLYS